MYLLFDMSARIISKYINFPDEAEELPLCNIVKAKRIRNFNHLVDIPPIYINLCDKESDPYLYLEKEICYRRSLTIGL